ncbi:alpha/beta hydrolase [soil metagenome]
MIKDIKIEQNRSESKSNHFREKLLSGLPVVENQYLLAGMPTTVLEGGKGLPLILLHGPGESAIWWMRVIPELVSHYQVIAPDLPGHGASGWPEEVPDADHVLSWLSELIDNTCADPPVLIGHVLGGAIATRFAIKAPKKLAHLIVVDSLGLASFRPAPLFAFELLRFMIRPNEKSYLRFLPQCMYNVNELSSKMGKMGTPKISKNELATIHVPVTLIWGRHDRANRLSIAAKASKRFGWPLHIIENCRDDPKLEQPNDFIKAIQAAIADTRRVETENVKNN